MTGVTVRDAERAKVEAVSRAMCRAAGFDPNQMVHGGTIDNGYYKPQRGPFGSFIVPELNSQTQAWMLYAPLAQAAIDEMERRKA